MGREYKNLGTKIDHGKTLKNVVISHMRRNFSLEDVRYRINQANIILKEPDNSSFLCRAYLEFKRLISNYMLN